MSSLACLLYPGCPFSFPSDCLPIYLPVNFLYLFPLSIHLLALRVSHLAICLFLHLVVSLRVCLPSCTDLHRGRQRKYFVLRASKEGRILSVEVRVRRRTSFSQSSLDLLLQSKSLKERKDKAALGKTTRTRRSKSCLGVSSFPLLTADFSPLLFRSNPRRKVRERLLSFWCMSWRIRFFCLRPADSAISSSSFCLHSVGRAFLLL